VPSAVSVVGLIQPSVLMNRTLPSPALVRAATAALVSVTYHFLKIYIA